MNAKPCHSILSCLETNEAAQMFGILFLRRMLYRKELFYSEVVCSYYRVCPFPIFLRKKVQQLYATVK